MVKHSLNLQLAAFCRLMVRTSCLDQHAWWPCLNPNRMQMDASTQRFARFYSQPPTLKVYSAEKAEKPHLNTSISFIKMFHGIQINKSWKIIIFIMTLIQFLIDKIVLFQNFSPKEFIVLCTWCQSCIPLNYFKIQILNWNW